MPQPLMPKATAVWLIDNTKLSFTQIAEFCGLHELEVQALADGDVNAGMQGLNPTLSGQITMDDIRKAEENPALRLKMIKSDLPAPVKRSKGPRYTPVSKRQDKPDGIYWLVKNHPELLDAQIARLIGTTKQTIAAIRDRQHWNSTNIKAKNPVALGLCSMTDLDAAIAKAQRRIKNAEKRAAKAARLQEQAASPQLVDDGGSAASNTAETTVSEEKIAEAS